MTKVLRVFFVLAGLAALLASGNALAHEIKSRMNGLCLDVPGAEFMPGAGLQMYSCNHSHAQEFAWTPEGELLIHGLCVDALGGRGHKGDRVGLSECNGRPSQRWVAEEGRLVGIRGLCMDIAKINSGIGGAVILWDCNGGDSQSWSGAGRHEATGPRGHAREGHALDGRDGNPIRSELNGLCLDVPGADFQPGANLQTYACNGSAAQRFEQTPAGELMIGGLCVDALGGMGHNGDRVGLWQCTGGPNQRWLASDGRLVGIKGRCLDIANRNPRPGAAIILWDCNGGRNQSWSGAGNHASFVPDGYERERRHGGPGRY